MSWQVLPAAEVCIESRQSSSVHAGDEELAFRDTQPPYKNPVSSGLSFLRGWAGGLTEPFMGRGCMGHQVLGRCLICTQAHLPRGPGVASVLLATANAFQPT